MKRTSILVATLATLATGLHAADEYRWEAGLGFQQQTTDTDPEMEATLLQARGRYHLLAPVSFLQHPWEEAEFLEHSTWIEARVGRATAERDPVEADGLTYGISGRYADKDVPVSVEVALDWASLEDEDYDVDSDVFTWELRVGYWVMPNLNAGLGYTATTDDDGSDKTTDDTIFAWGKWVHGLDADLDLNVEAEIGQISYEEADGENVFATAEGGLYIRKQWGIGLLVGTESGDAAEDEGLILGVRGSAWFTENVGLRAGYTTFAASDEDQGVDTDTIQVELVGRF